LHEVQKLATIPSEMCPAFGPNREHWEVMAKKNGPIGTPPDSPLGFAHTNTIYTNEPKELIAQGAPSNIRAKWESLANKNGYFGILSPLSSNLSDSQSSPLRNSTSDQFPHVVSDDEGAYEIDNVNTASAIKNILGPLLDCSEGEKCDTDSTSEDSQSDDSQYLVEDYSCQQKDCELDEILDKASSKGHSDGEEEREGQVYHDDTSSEHSVNISCFESSDVNSCSEDEHEGEHVLKKDIDFAQECAKQDHIKVENDQTQSARNVVSTSALIETENQHLSEESQTEPINDCSVISENESNRNIAMISRNEGDFNHDEAGVLVKKVSVTLSGKNDWITGDGSPRTSTSSEDLSVEDLSVSHDDSHTNCDCSNEGEGQEIIDKDFVVEGNEYEGDHELSTNSTASEDLSVSNDYSHTDCDCSNGGEGKESIDKGFVVEESFPSSQGNAYERDHGSSTNSTSSEDLSMEDLSIHNDDSHDSSGSSIIISDKQYGRLEEMTEESTCKDSVQSHLDSKSLNDTDSLPTLATKIPNDRHLYESMTMRTIGVPIGAKKVKSDQVLKHKITQIDSPLPDPRNINGNGFVLARTSQITKLWRAIYWIRYGTSCIILFRSKQDFDRWISNPSCSEKKRASMVLRRIDFINDLSKGGIKGFRQSKLKSKTGKRSGKEIYKFKVEAGSDSGVSTIVAFSSQSKKEVDLLRKSVEECLCNIPGNSEYVDGSEEIHGEDCDDWPDFRSLN
jgi:hypothetical protein